MRIQLPLTTASIPQAQFIEDIWSHILMFSGGYGSGKTYGIGLKAMQLSMINRNLPGGLMAPSYKEMRRDVIPTIDDILEKMNIKRWDYKRDDYIRFPWTRGKIYLFSGKEKVRGPNLAFFLFNEMTLLEAERIREGIGRVRLKRAPHPQIAGSGTPEGLSNWCYKKLVQKPMKNSRLIFSKTDDNLHNLHGEYVENMVESFDEISLKAYREGQWINMTEGQFYFAFNTAINCDPLINQMPGMHVHCALDFNVQNMTATLWHYNGAYLLGFDEIVLKNNADTKKMGAALINRGYGPNNTTIYPDPAGRARSTKGKPDIDQLKGMGFLDIRVRNAAPQFRRRQLNVNNLLDKGIIVFNPEKMPQFQMDLMAVSQDPVTLEKDKSDPERTHASDGVDYMCDILFPWSGERPESTVDKLR